MHGVHDLSKKAKRRRKCVKIPMMGDIVEYSFTRSELLYSLSLLKRPPKDRTVSRRCRQRQLHTNKSMHHHSFSYYRVLDQLREALLRNRWSDAVRLVLVLIDGPNRLKAIVWQCLFRILWSHPLATEELKEEFIRTSLGCSDEHPMAAVVRLLQADDNEVNMKK